MLLGGIQQNIQDYIQDVDFLFFIDYNLCDIKF